MSNNFNLINIYIYIYVCVYIRAKKNQDPGTLGALDDSGLGRLGQGRPYNNCINYVFPWAFSTGTTLHLRTTLSQAPAHVLANERNNSP